MKQKGLALSMKLPVEGDVFKPTRAGLEAFESLQEPHEASIAELPDSGDPQEDQSICRACDGSGHCACVMDYDSPVFCCDSCKDSLLCRVCAGTGVLDE